MRLVLVRSGQKVEVAAEDVMRVVPARDVVLEPTGQDGLWLGLAGGMVVLAEEPSLPRPVAGPREAPQCIVLRQVNGDLRQAWLADGIDWMPESTAKSLAQKRG